MLQTLILAQYISPQVLVLVSSKSFWYRLMQNLKKGFEVYSTLCHTKSFTSLIKIHKLGKLILRKGYYYQVIINI